MPIAYVRGAGLICCHKKTIPYSILSILYIGFLSSRFDGFLWCHLPKFHTSDAQVSHKNFSCFFLQRYTFYSKIAINMGIIFTAGQRLPNGNTRRDTEPFRPCYLRKKPLKLASYQIFLSCKYPYNYLIVQTFCKIKNPHPETRARNLKIYTNYLIFRFGLPAAVVARIGKPCLIHVRKKCRRVFARRVNDHLDNPLD